MKVLGLLTVLCLLAPALADLEASPLCNGVPLNETFLFPYPGDCSRFFRCEDGIQSVEDCPSGLWFNQALQSCDHPDDSGCANLVCPPGIVDFFPDPDDCGYYVECYNGTPERHSCPSGLWFNAVQKRCVSQASSDCGVYSTSIEPTWSTPHDACWGVLPGVIILRPYPDDCTQFYECVGAVLTVLSCPPLLYFDEAKQLCDQPAISGCDDSVGPTVPTAPTPPPENDDPRCFDGNNDFWPDPECTMFVECYEGHGYRYPCPDGLYFNADTKECMNPGASGCGTTSPMPTDTTTNGGGTIDPICMWPTPGRYLFPYPGNCSLFIECWEGERIVEECPPDLWFNAVLEVCDYPYHSGCRP